MLVKAIKTRPLIPPKDDLLSVIKESSLDIKEKSIIIIHRAILGSYERFIAYLLEQTNGNLPVWLSPIQVGVLSISEENVDYVKFVEKKLADSGMRVEGNYENHTIQHKIRDAQLQKIPYILVIGQKEKANKTIAVRTRDGEVKYGIKLENFIKRIQNEVKQFK